MSGPSAGGKGRPAGSRAAPDLSRPGWPRRSEAGQGRWQGAQAAKGVSKVTVHDARTWSARYPEQGEQPIFQQPTFTPPPPYGIKSASVHAAAG